MALEEDEKLSIALFGFGRMGRIHFNTLLQNSYRSNLAYIVDDFPEMVHKDIDRWGLKNTKILRPSQSEKVLSDESLDAVIICVPTEKHVDLIKLALTRKKHVMCEKPVALTVEGTLLCYELAETHGLTLFCGLQRLFDPDFSRIQNQVADGSLGKIQVVSHYVRDHPEPVQAMKGGLGNMFADMGAHSVSVLNWIIGEKPISVTAFGHAHNETYAARNDFDAYGMMLKYPCGAIGFSDSTRVTPHGYDTRLEV